ncbi:AzlD domain-containing protein [Nocardioides sambongensis]|uniref:AzlD domain-containing protein n=1 Tax=Nocardioides sambongensis TaxID=2589074 RepID=UPI00112CBD4B|nr:AzlD domain-containing protein [Nocardioides sambongensis]
MIWWAILAACAGCYALKLAGLAVPASVLARPWVARVADLIPVALLSALVAVQVMAGTDAQGDQVLVVDARLAGLGCAVVLLLARAPFLVVVVGSAALAALLRAL